MWNPYESHIPLNGCKDTNFSRTLQTFHCFLLHLRQIFFKATNLLPVLTQMHFCIKTEIVKNILIFGDQNSRFSHETPNGT